MRALRQAPNGLSRTDIRDLFARNRKGEDLERALNLLAERGHAVLEQVTTDGRSREVWRSTATTKTTERAKGVRPW